MTKWLLLGCAILAEVTGSLSLKSALHHPCWYAVVLVGYISSFVFLDLVLRRGVPLGVAYAIWGALGVALTAGLAAVIFGETLTPVMLFGIAVVIAGVLCIELGHPRVAEQKAKES